MSFLNMFNIFFGIYWFAHFMFFILTDYQPDNFTIGVALLLAATNFIGLYLINSKRS